MKFNAYQISEITEGNTVRLKIESQSGKSTSYANAKLIGQAAVRGKQFGGKGATWRGCTGEQVVGENGAYRLVSGVDFVAAPKGAEVPSEEPVAA